MGRWFSEFEVGQTFESQGRTIGETDVTMFAALTGDWNPLHTDAEFAAKTPFGKRVGHGMLSASVATGLSQTLGIFDGTTLALMSQTWAYKGPVFFGDTIRVRLVVESVTPSSKPGRGVVGFRCDVVKQDGAVVVTGPWAVLMADKPV